MKTLYQLNDALRVKVNTEYRFQNDAKTINDNINRYIDSLMFTKTRKLRYPLHYAVTMRHVAFQLRRVAEESLIIFGYWYEGNFYTTQKDIPEYRNTNMLHTLELPQTDWDKMPRGFYYRSNLKPYFID